MDIFEKQDVPLVEVKNKISFSFLKTWVQLIKMGKLNEMSFHREETPDTEKSEGLLIGDFVHQAMESRGNSIADLVFIDESRIKKLSSAEAKVLQYDDLTEGYLEVYDNETTRTYEKSIKSQAKVKKAIDIIKQKLDHNNKLLEEHKDNVILNDYKNIKNATSFKNRVQRCYNSIIHNPDLSELFSQLGDIEYNESEYRLEWGYQGYLMKAIVDKFIFSEGRLIVIDYKTYSWDTIYTKILSGLFTLQLSMYIDGLRTMLEADGFEVKSVEAYVMGVNTRNYESNLVKISEDALNKAKYGGYLKTNIHSKFDGKGGFDPYLNFTQIEALKNNEFWTTTDKNYNEFYTFGWQETLDAAIESGRLEFLNAEKI